MSLKAILWPGPPPQVRTLPGNPAEILVVDGEQSLQLLDEVLGRAGSNSNSRGRQGLETLAQTQVSAVIVDLMMPEMNGFEFIVRVREQPRFQNLHLFVLTAEELRVTISKRYVSTKAVFLKTATWREDLFRSCVQLRQWPRLRVGNEKSTGRRRPREYP